MMKCLNMSIVVIFLLIKDVIIVQCLPNASINNDVVPIIYPMSSPHLLVTVLARSTVPLILQDVPNGSNATFVLVQAHSQSHSVVLSHTRKPNSNQYVNATNAGLVVPIPPTPATAPDDTLRCRDDDGVSKSTSCQYKLPKSNDEDNGVNHSYVTLQLFIGNNHTNDFAVLLFAHVYFQGDPVPGGGSLPSDAVSQPYLQLQPGVLTSIVTIPPAAPTLTPIVGVMLSGSEGPSVSTRKSKEGENMRKYVTVGDRELNDIFGDERGKLQSVMQGLHSSVSKLKSSVKELFSKRSNSLESKNKHSIVNTSFVGNSNVSVHLMYQQVNPNETLSQNSSSALPILPPPAALVQRANVSKTLPREVPVNPVTSQPAFDTSTNDSLLYEVFLTYMYEGDMNEDQYWQVLIQTSTPQGLRQYATKVAEYTSSPSSSDPPPYLFVSYSGVGAIVNVLVSNVNGSLVGAPLTNGSMYSSSVSYGCDFIPEEKYRCTKLITPLAQVFCACLLFIGLVLAFLGHRWLNFTVFTAAFLAAWLLTFLVLVRIPGADLAALGVWSALLSVACSALWLLLWHRLQRPLLTALPIVLEAALLGAMLTTHCLKFVLPATSHYLAVFLVFPVMFSVLLVAYSVRRIKAVHIFSCCFVGSYSCVVPLSFYFGSTLSYVVINAVAAVAVPGYSAAVGFPPFQTCDIVLSVVWAMLLGLSLGYQRYRERSSPPFPPPNLQYYRATVRAGTFLYHQALKLIRCGAGAEDVRYHSQAEEEEDPVVGVSQLGNSGAGLGYGGVDGNMHSAQAHGSLSSRIRDNFGSVKSWVSSGFRFRERSNFEDYRSFPRYPGENVDEAQHSDLDDALPQSHGPESQVRTAEGIGRRISNAWVSFRNTVVYRSSKSRSLFRRRVLVNDSEQDNVVDDVTSGSSDDEEVDRRAVGIFGHPDDAETASARGSLSQDDESYVDANDTHDGEDVLADRHLHSFGSSQLTLQ